MVRGRWGRRRAVEVLKEDVTKYQATPKPGARYRAAK
jgi:hypothetical protein